MINVKEELRTVHHESTLIVQQTLKKKGRIKKDIIKNLFDVVSYCKNYCRLKGIEYDENKIEEILTLSKKQLIVYGLNNEGKPNIIKSK